MISREPNEQKPRFKTTALRNFGTARRLNMTRCLIRNHYRAARSEEAFVILRVLHGSWFVLFHLHLLHLRSLDLASVPSPLIYSERLPFHPGSPHSGVGQHVHIAIIPEITL